MPERTSQGIEELLLFHLTLSILKLIGDMEQVTEVKKFRRWKLHTPKYQKILSFFRGVI